MAKSERTLTIRDRETNEAVEVIDVSHLSGTTNFDRFYDGLVMKVNFERFYIDDSAEED